MKTAPFNLEQALAGKPVVTDFQESVKEIKYYNTADAPVVGTIDGKIYAWSVAGKRSDGVGNLRMLITPHKPLPESVPMPNGYRLLEKGEKLPVGALYLYPATECWYLSTNGSFGADPDYCYIVPDYSTGLWQEQPNQETK